MRGLLPSCLLACLLLVRAESFVSLVEEGSACSSHCALFGPRASCLAACAAGAECACDEEHPWEVRRCQPSEEEASVLQLCSCTDGLSDHASADDQRSAIFGGEISGRLQHVIADEYVVRARAAAADPMCGAEGEMDGENANPDLAFLSEAVRRMRRCGLVVIRKAISKSFVEAFRKPFSEYVHGLTNGSISIDGWSSLNEPYFIHKLDERRWELLLPRSFAAHEVFNSIIVRTLLSHFSVLGKDYVLHSLGAALSEPGASPLHWHRDSRSPLKDAGVVGDAPSHAVTLLTPLLDVTQAHGPTEFCIGTSHLAGLDRANHRLLDQTLAPFMNDEGCPDGLTTLSPKLKVSQSKHAFLRQRFNLPLHLQMGDILLFDYNMIHRAAPNKSPQMRAWFKDVGNFDNYHQVELALQNSKPRCQKPLEFSVETHQPNVSPEDLEDLDRVIRHARYAEVCPGSSPADGSTEANLQIEDIPELFPSLNERMREAGLEFEDAEGEELTNSELQDNVDGEDCKSSAYDSSADRCQSANRGSKSESILGSRWRKLDFACSARAYFSAPLISAASG